MQMFSCKIVYSLYLIVLNDKNVDNNMCIYINIVERLLVWLGIRWRLNFFWPETQLKNMFPCTYFNFFFQCILKILIEYFYHHFSRMRIFFCSKSNLIIIITDMTIEYSIKYPSHMYYDVSETKLLIRYVFIIITWDMRICGEHFKVIAKWLLFLLMKFHCAS